MIYYVVGTSLFLTNVESDARVVELDQDYKTIWEELNIGQPGKSLDQKLKASREIKEFIDFLVKHNALPEQHSKTSAMAQLLGTWGKRSIKGSFRIEEPAEDMAVFGSYTEGYNGCEIESSWSESGPQPNHIRCK